MNVDLKEFARCLAGVGADGRLFAHAAEVGVPSEVLISATQHSRLVSNLQAVQVSPASLFHIEVDE